jgi:hypothetical protein
MRVTESLVAAASVLEASPAQSELLAQIATDLLSEAESWLDQELVFDPMRPDSPARRDLQRLTELLRRGQEIARDHPGAALTLAGDILRELATPREHG